MCPKWVPCFSNQKKEGTWWNDLRAMMIHSAHASITYPTMMRKWRLETLTLRTEIQLHLRIHLPICFYRLRRGRNRPWIWELCLGMRRKRQCSQSNINQCKTPVYTPSFRQESDSHCTIYKEKPNHHCHDGTWSIIPIHPNSILFRGPNRARMRLVIEIISVIIRIWSLVQYHRMVHTSTATEARGAISHHSIVQLLWFELRSISINIEPSSGVGGTKTAICLWLEWFRCKLRWRNIRVALTKLNSNHVN